MKTSVQNIPTPVSITQCPSWIQLQTLWMGIILTWKLTFWGHNFLTKVVLHTMKTGILNILTPVRMTPCPPRLQLQTLWIGGILSGWPPVLTNYSSSLSWRENDILVRQLLIETFLNFSEEAASDIECDRTGAWFQCWQDMKSVGKMSTFYIHIQSFHLLVTITFMHFLPLLCFSFPSKSQARQDNWKFVCKRAETEMK